MNQVAKQWARRGAALAWCGVIFALSAMPDVTGPSFLDALPHADKIIHFILYFILGYLTIRSLRREPAVAFQRHAFMLALAWCALYGISDEWHQHFVPGRHPDVMDWLADSLGGRLRVVSLSGKTNGCVVCD